ncbi:MAG TPA: TIM barrel protein [Opitutaceae bacterium]|nr:TIM barrel protein [Opitutaceae bacterium]
MSSPRPTRRDFVTWLAAAPALAAAASRLPAAEPKLASAGRLKQSIVHWCFARGAQWKVADTVKAALELGCVSVEGVQPVDWPLLKQNGLKCAYVGAHTFVQGMNNPIFWDANLKAIHDRIDACAEYGNPNVLSFTGYADTRAQGGSVISAEAGKRNCIEAYKKVMAYAERKGVTLLLEHLNSRDAGDMKGHPGYQGDDVSYCADIVRAVDSPRMKLLFDIYHVQIMHGDLTRRLDECKDVIGHIHTAGNPGRNEIGPSQEINYRPLMQKLLALGYAGYVGHEFIPTREPMAGLREAVGICAVR